MGNAGKKHYQHDRQEGMSGVYKHKSDTVYGSVVAEPVTEPTICRDIPSTSENSRPVMTEVIESPPFSRANSEDPYNTIHSMDVEESEMSETVNIKEIQERWTKCTRDSEHKDQNEPSKRLGNSTGNLMEYLACEVYRSVLARRLQADEIARYLDFIDISDIERAENPRKSVYQLLTSIHRSTVPGKWESFSQSLIRTENLHPRDLITGKTEKDNCQDAMVLKLYQPEIAKDISLDDMLDCLTEEEVITEVDKERVKARQKERGETHAAMLLLDLVPNRKEDWNEKLIKSLRRCGLGEFANYLEEVSKNKADEETSFKEIASRRLNPYSQMPSGGLKGNMASVNSGQGQDCSSTNMLPKHSPVPLSPDRIAFFENRTGYNNNSLHNATGTNSDRMPGSPVLRRKSSNNWKIKAVSEISKTTSHDDFSDERKYDDTLVKRLSGFTPPANTNTTTKSSGTTIDDVTAKEKIQRIDLQLLELEQQKRKILASNHVNVTTEDERGYTKLLLKSTPHEWLDQADDTHLQETQLINDDINDVTTDPEILEVIVPEGEACLERDIDDTCNKLSNEDHYYNTTSATGGARLDIGEICDPNKCEAQELVVKCGVELLKCETTNELEPTDIDMGTLYGKIVRIEELIERKMVDSYNRNTEEGNETQPNNDANNVNIGLVQVIQELVSKVTQLEIKLDEVSNRGNYINVESVPIEEHQLVQINPHMQPLFIPPQTPPWFPLREIHPVSHQLGYPTPLMSHVGMPYPYNTCMQ